ncbi:MAG: hypothetical protein J5599_04390, partial [Spirochaetales bacterium]|nr:hypothetical protein [Spirochaetales bacterium]
SIRETVDKALEWEKIAIENKAKVSKEIPDSSLKMQIAEKSGSSFYIGSYKVPVTFSFVSTEDAGLTTLMIIGGTTTASSNKYIDLEFQSQVITDISSFAEAISEKAISSAIAKHNDDLNVADDLFK